MQMLISKSLKDIGCGHTIYRNGTKWLWMKHMALNWQKSRKKFTDRKNRKKKSLLVSGRWVGSIGPPETQVFFFFWP